MAENMNGLKRTSYCGDLSERQIDTLQVVAGWADRVRDLGNLVFIDLRDRSGIVQLAFDDQTDRALLKKAASVRAEYVLMASGRLRRRQSPNPELKTGQVELYVTELRILSQSATPPFEIADESRVKEELRLKHRYLDLRRAPLQQAILTRHRIVKAVRDYFDRHGFVEIETPMLIKSTPEGARDYLVPSRVHPGCFYALPQSPQIYKQLSMLAGFDRYMQIARCFRDEDLRADRQPEFTQIDLEMSFVDETDVQTINEGLVAELFSEILGVEVSLPLPRLFYAEAMERYGSDKPDTRFGLELVNLSDLLGGCGFGVFSGAVAAGGSVRGIRVPKGASAFSRKEIDRLTEFVKTYRAKGLAYTRLSPEGETSSFEKFLALDEVAALRGRMGAQPGDLLLLVADADNKVVFDSLGALRVELGKRLGLIDMKRFDCLWVTDFPLFEYDPEEGRYFAMHHPFTSPNLEDVQNGAAQGKMRARAYDLVINGTEIGGGSIRISDPELQGWMFAQLGMTPEEAQARFGFLLDAFRYGVPPHGGMAYGLDRLVMIMLGRESLREVIAFPKVQNASELMSGAPAPVEAKSLDELDIALKPHVTA